MSGAAGGVALAGVSPGWAQPAKGIEKLDPGFDRQNVVLVPNAAIVQRAGKSVAFVVADGKAAMRELQLGISDGKQTEVLGGLEQGDQLIVAGQETLNDGDNVRQGSRTSG